MEFTANDITLIVQEVIKSMGSKEVSTPEVKSKGNYGAFEKVEDAVEAADVAQKLLVRKYSMDQRKRLINALRVELRKNADLLARKVYEETKLGIYADKIEKHLAVIDHTPGPEFLTTDAVTGDYGLMVEEYAPFGVIGAITPVTNPTETIINNAISMISGGNTVVFNVHPSAKKTCEFCIQLMNRTIIENKGPANLLTMVLNPTLDTVAQISNHPKIRMMVGTGGTAMVNALLKSGKKTIGAGAGNPPVIVDETANLKKAAQEIHYGASFDNNILCLAEKEAFVVEEVASAFIGYMKEEGAYLLEGQEKEKVLQMILPFKEGYGYQVNKEFIGKDASLILEKAGIQYSRKPKLLICEVKKDHPLVLKEQMMPVFPIVRVKSIEEAIEAAVIAENGNRHTASIFSRDVDHMTMFAKAIETTIFVKNGNTLRGVGIGGEGYATMTIAGPTGEGITNVRSFTRRRRCMLADGGLRIV